MPQTMLSNNIMSTKTFMNEIDLRCDDHLYKYKEDVQATRYCSDCKCLCCDSCVIEFHNAHIAAAKTKIEDYFRKQKLELEDLRSKINSSIKIKVNFCIKSFFFFCSTYSYYTYIYQSNNIGSIHLYPFGNLWSSPSASSMFFLMLLNECLRMS